MKVSELSGASLDYWVSRANGNPAKISDDGTFAISKGHRYSPSSDWRFGGPIIEREAIDISCTDPYMPSEERYWMADSKDSDLMIGETALVAAMRAYVQSKFGDEVSD